MHCYIYLPYTHTHAHIYINVFNLFRKRLSIRRVTLRNIVNVVIYFTLQFSPRNDVQLTFNFF